MLGEALFLNLRYNYFKKLYLNILHIQYNTCVWPNLKLFPVLTRISHNPKGNYMFEVMKENTRFIGWISLKSLKVHLGPCQTSMMEVFCEELSSKRLQLLAITLTITKQLSHIFLTGP